MFCFRRIKLFHNVFITRPRSVTILPVESKKFTRADKIKKLNYENKYLYGPKLKEKETKKKKAEVVSKPVEEKKLKDTDKSSEIYWTCLHVPEVQDFTKPKKKVKAPKKAESEKKKRNKKDDEKVVQNNQLETPSSVSPDEHEIPMLPEKDFLNQNARKKAQLRSIVIAPQLPDSLSKLKTLPGAKSKVKKSLSSSFTLRTLEADSDDEDEREIPFENMQLRSIPNFPLFSKTSKLWTTFSKFDPETSIVRPPSVSKILQSTMPESHRIALLRWKNLKISELGLEGFEAMQKSHLSRGRQFHECLQRHFKGETVVESEIAPEVVDVWKSIETLLGNFTAPGVLIEEKVQHPYLCYQGVVDCVSFHDSTLSVIEWKKSDRQKKTLNYTFDAPLQLCSYLGALNASREEFLKNPIKEGIIVVAYNDGQKAELFKLPEHELKKYWKLWLVRLQEFWIRYRERTLPDEI